MVLLQCPVSRFPAVFCCNTDMAGILIIAHAPFATALRECVAHIYGGLAPPLGVIDVMPHCDPRQGGAPANSENQTLKEENGALVLTHIFRAAPPHNARG